MKFKFLSNTAFILENIKNAKKAIIIGIIKAFKSIFFTIIDKYGKKKKNRDAEEDYGYEDYDEDYDEEDYAEGEEEQE